MFYDDYVSVENYQYCCYKAKNKNISLPSAVNIKYI